MRPWVLIFAILCLIAPQAVHAQERELLLNTQWADLVEASDLRIRFDPGRTGATQGGVLEAVVLLEYSDGNASRVHARVRCFQSEYALLSEQHYPADGQESTVIIHDLESPWLRAGPDSQVGRWLRPLCSGPYRGQPQPGGA